MEIYIDGQKIEKKDYGLGYWLYEFIAPTHNVDVELKYIPAE